MTHLHTTTEKSAKTWPTTRDGIISEYDRREESLLGAAYRYSEVTRLGLFRALDSSGKETIAARRLIRDILFVIGVDAAAIASDTLKIDAPGGRYAGGDDDKLRTFDIASAVQLWRMSDVYSRAHEWATMFCTLGQWHWEAVQTTEGPRIIGHDPRAVRLQYDPLGLTLIQAVVTLRYRDPIDIDADGAETAGEWHTYKRILTRTDVRVYVDDVLQSAESGPHSLGVVPLTTAKYQPVAGKELPMWAGQGMEDALSVVDSMLTQVMAIGTRHANPILLVLGASLGEGADVQALGRMLEAGKDVDIKWLEAALQGLKALSESAVMLRDMIRDTSPEFLFMDSGATASGTALGYRAQAFVAKIDPIRQRWYDALALATSYGMAMMRGIPWSADDHTLVIDGGDALALDRSAAAQLFTGLAADGFMTRTDAVVRLQGLGLIDEDEDPDGYATAALSESKAALGEQIAELSRLAEVMALLQARQLPEPTEGGEDGTG